MKKVRNILLVILLTLCLALQVNAAEDEIQSSGKLGENVTYTVAYSEEGNFMYTTVQGTGPMDRRYRDSFVQKLFIEEGVTEVCYEGFFGYSQELTSIYIAGSVESIGAYAFQSVYGMNYLTEVSLNEGLSTIGNSAFISSPNLTSLVFPSTVTWIGYDAFRYGGLTEITFLGGPPTICDYAFANVLDEDGEMVPLTVYYPDDGSWSRGNMQWLYRPTTYIPYTIDEQGNRIPDESRAYSLSNTGTFEGGGSWYIDENGILHIEGAKDITTDDPGLDEAWAGIIHGLVVEPGVENFYHDFVGYSKLSSVTFSDDLKIGPTFQHCEKLENVDLGEGLTVIREKNFYHCFGVRYLDIPASVTDIYEAAFDHCHWLTRFTFRGDRPTFHFEDPSKPNILNRRMENWESWQGEMGGGPIEVFYPSGNLTWTEDLDQLVLGSTIQYVPYTVASDGYDLGDYDNAQTVVGIVDYHIGGGGIGITLYANSYAFVDIVDVEAAEDSGYGAGALIGQYNSEKWRNVKHIKIGEGIVSIYSLGLHQEITHEVTFSFPSTLTEIGDGAFRGLQCIYSLDLNNVTQIGKEAFYGCANLKSVPLTHVTKIGEGAFYGCTSLESVTLSDELTEIAQSTFKDSGLVEITLPDSVTSIGDNAFFNCQQLEQVDLGNHLKSIGYGAFQKCLALENLEFPDSLEFVGAGSFAETGLREVSLGPNAVLDTPREYTNYYGVFQDCDQLTKVVLSEGITELPEDCFAYCDQLESITIPDSMTDIYDWALWGCTSLKSLDLNNAWVDLDQLQLDIIEHLVLGNGCSLNPGQGIRANYFPALKSVVIPEGITQIDAYAFSACENLETVIIENAEAAIYEEAFSYCTNLKEVQLGDQVTSIGARAFWECSALKEIDIPGSVDTIYEDAFYGCSSLASVTFHEGLKDIRDGAFNHCPLVHIDIPSTVTTLGNLPFKEELGGAFWYCEELVSANIRSTELNEIRNGYFWGCDKLETITLSEGLEDIHNEAFEYLPALKTVSIPSTVTWIGRNSFYECKNLTNLVLPDGLKNIKEYAFYNCGKLSSVTLPEGLLEIGSYAFADTGLKEVTVPSSINYIEESEYTFAFCDQLEHVTFNAEKIWNSGFYMCESLTTVELSNVITIEPNAFMYSEKLSSVNFPEGLWGIGSYAFYGCASLTSVTLPDSVTSLAYDLEFGDGNYAGTFAHCNNLKEVKLGQFVRDIPRHCFVKTAIENLDLSNVMRIDTEGIMLCDQLTTITLSGAVQYLAERAISSLTNLKQIVFLGHAPNTEGDAFSGLGPAFSCMGNEWYSIYRAELREEFASIAGYCRTIEYTTNENGEMIVVQAIPEETTVAEQLNTDLKNQFPEGYPVDKFSVSKLNMADYLGYGSQAFAYILSDAVFGDLPAELDWDVAFDEVKVGDILRIDSDSRAVVIVEKQKDHVVVAQGDWKGEGTVHWGETLTAAQVEAADYRISRYSGIILLDMDALDSYAPQFPEAPSEPPTEDEVYQIILTQKSSFAEGFPYNEEIKYIFDGEYEGNQVSMNAQACAAFAYYVSDRAFGDAPMRRAEDIAFENIMIGDLVHYDPDPNDNTTHIVVVLEVYQDRLLTVEANYNDTVHWGRMFTKDEFEKLLDLEVYTRYPEGTTPTAREAFNCSHSYMDNGQVFAPTCYSVGYTLYCCNSCGEGFIRNNVDALDHELSEWVTTREPTATTEGEKSRACKHECGYIETEIIAALGGIDDETTPTEPEETEPTNPSEPEDTDPTDPPCEHRWTQWEVTSPTSEKEGLRTRECEICGEAETEVLRKLSGEFTDVPENLYYALPVDWAVQKGITTGMSENSFAPDSECTRGQIVTFLWRAAGKPEPTTSQNPFKDVTISDYFYKAVLWAVEQGITTGTGADTFSPASGCTRAQVATFLWRAQGKPAATSKNPFTDVNQGEYYYEAVIWAVEKGVTTGTSATTFAPNATCTRGQIVTFLYRAIA